MPVLSRTGFFCFLSQGSHRGPGCQEPGYRAVVMGGRYPSSDGRARCPCFTMCTHYTLKKFHFRWYYSDVRTTSWRITKIVLIITRNETWVPITELLRFIAIRCTGRTTSSTTNRPMPKSLSPAPIWVCTKQLISLSIQLRSHENNPAACSPAYGRFFQ